jgi:hypothetical protein
MLLLQEILSRIADSSYLQREHLENIRNFSGNIYDALNIIPNDQLFKYITISIVIILISIHLNITAGHFFGVFISLIIIYVYLQKDTKSKVGINKDYQLKNDFINEYLFIEKPYYTYEDDPDTYLNINESDIKVSYFGQNRVILNFIYDVREYAIIHPVAFNKLLEKTNSVIKIRVQVQNGVRDCKAMIPLAEDSRTEALNNFQSIIYNLPSTTETNNKFQNNLAIFVKLLQAEIDYINELCDIQNSNLKTSILSKPYGINYGPKGKDDSISPHFDFF